MFSPGLEKSCARPESCSPGRNASTRFPVGIPPLGDENQQISRIQLAVQKYNNTSSFPINNRSGFLSPVRHCLLKNTLRSKNYETEEGLIKNEKKSGNYYEGVGAFPTIHLRKSAVRYRPIKRFRDVKVPYPELPVNRYLSHLPELHTDLKSSTRSVLDVLQDLSAKKIQDEDDGSNKTKSKGLAGDYIMDPNAVYKPLFVQKPKTNLVTTRDSMTQTLSPFRSDTPSPQICNLSSRNDVSDPRAELRRKLAKQNNEISASLSSSITSFAIKRKIDRVVNVKDDNQSSDVSAVKKSRIDYTNQTENGFTNSTNNKNEPTKLNRKLKIMEASSPSPNKDRLTTIFLDIRNTSPKSKIFQDSDTPKSNAISNGFASNPPAVNGSVETIKTPELSTGELPKTDSGKSDNEQVKPAFSFPVNKSDNPSPKPSTPMCQFGLSNNTSFNFKPTGSPLASSKDSTDASETSVNQATSNDKKEESSKTFSFGSNETNLSGFKFGSDTIKSPVEEKTEISVAGVAITTASLATPPQFTFGVKSTDMISPRPSTQSTFTAPGQFTFGQTGSSSGEASKTTTSPTTVSSPSISQNMQAGVFTFGQKSSVESPIQTNIQTSVNTSTPSTIQAPSSESSVGLSSTAPTGSLFSFGHKVETASTTAPATSAAEQKPQFTFTFGQKTELPKAPEIGQKNLFTFGQKSVSETSQSNAVATSQQTPTSPQTFGQTSVAQTGISFGATTFGGYGTAVTSSNSAQSTTQPTFAVSTTQAPLLATTGQSTSTFGVATTSTSAFGASTTTPTFGAFTTTTSAFGAATTTTSAFGASTTTTSAFGAATTTTSAFGAATTTTSAFGAATTTTSAFGAATTATPSFGAVTTTTPSFGASTQPTFKFGASTIQTNFGVSSSSNVASTTTATTTTQSAPAFGLNTNQPTPPAFSTSTSAQPTQVFGTAATQPTPTFGVSSSAPGFGTSTTSASLPAFGTTTSASTSIFGASSSALTIPSFGTPTTQNAFGAPTAQTTPAFGASPSQSIPAFGTSSTPAFGGSSTVQSTSSFGSSTATSTPAFGASVSNGFGASSQPNSIFGAPASTQSGFGVTTNTSVFGSSGSFGATSSQSNAGFGTSGGTQTTSAFGAQPFGKPSAPSIFGQSTAPAFPSGSNFVQTQNNIFGAKPSEKEMFGQNKMFGAQNNFQFGSTANSTGFTTSPPTTAAAPVFSFGSGGSATNTFSFSANSTAGSSNTQTPFAFTPKEPFKFGATTSKENTGFGIGTSPNFNFGNQMNNATTNQTFDFRQTQNNTAPGFNFSAGSSSSSPSVFSFGGSGSSTNSNRGFNFGAPTPGASFGQSTPTFGVPGTFSIGSGSSQSRPRAASRLRRRP